MRGYDDISKDKLMKEKMAILKANFKKLPEDSKIEIPILASFFSFLANAAL